MLGELSKERGGGGGRRNDEERHAIGRLRRRYEYPSRRDECSYDPGFGEREKRDRETVESERKDGRKREKDSRGSEGIKDKADKRKPGPTQSISIPVYFDKTR